MATTTEDDMAMAELIIAPRQSDTGAMGHISNTALPAWFQDGRKALLQRAAPLLTPAEWVLLVARYEVELLRQMVPDAPVTIRSGVEGLGNSSIRFFQQAWQHGRLSATGRAVLVHFDTRTQRSCPLTPAMRTFLATQLIAAEPVLQLRQGRQEQAQLQEQQGAQQQ